MNDHLTNFYLKDIDRRRQSELALGNRNHSGLKQLIGLGQVIDPKFDIPRWLAKWIKGQRGVAGRNSQRKLVIIRQVDGIDDRRSSQNIVPELSEQMSVEHAHR